MHKLCIGLMRRGHTVSVLTGYPNYPQGKIYPGYNQRLLKKEVVNGINITRLPLYPDRSSSFTKRSLNNLVYPLVASILGPFVCGNADVMMVQSPPITLGIPSYIISRIRNIPYIFQIQDIWPETLVATGMINNNKILNALVRLGTFTYNNAAAIAVISPGFKNNLIGKGVPPDKIHVIYNWAYEGEFPLKEPDPALATELNLIHRFNILYAGNMGPAQGLHNIIDAASLLTDLEDLQFVLMGSGIDMNNLKSMVSLKRLKNVKFLPRIAMDMMPSIYALVHAVMIHLTDDPLFEITIPGKTQSCLLSGCPIIASVNGNAADLIRRADAGFAVEAMNPIELAQIIRKLYSMQPHERDSMGARGRQFYFEHLSPDVGAKQYEKIFNKVSSNHKKGI